MQALTVVPSRAGTLAVHDVPDPVPGAGDLLVDGRRAGVVDGRVGGATAALGSVQRALIFRPWLWSPYRGFVTVP
jgi:hypothetical protein